VSAKTPNSYIKYLNDRNYDYILAGEIRVDFKKAFENTHKPIVIKLFFIKLSNYKRLLI
jgi:hypothetical protein